MRVHQQSILAAAIAIPFALVASYDPLLATALPLGIAAIVGCICGPATGAWFLLFGLLALGDLVALRRYEVGIGVFAADLVVPLLFGLCLKALPRSEQPPVPPRRALTTALAALALYGVFALSWALASAGHAVRDVIGDYRRFFIYPLSFFVGVYAARHFAEAFERVIRLSLIAALTIALVAITRIVTGTSFRPDQFGTEFRAFSYYDSTVLFIPLFYLLTRAFEPGPRRWSAVMGAALIAALQLASGYRLAWALTIVSPLLAAALVMRRSRRYGVGVWAALMFGVLGGVAVFILTATDLGELWRLRLMNLGAMITNFGLSWRYLSWVSAFRQFLDHPLLGVGIGDVHSFWVLSSAGMPLLTTHTPHNVVISILYQTGIVGLTLFLVVHGLYARLLWRASGRVPSVRLPHVIAIGGFYFAAATVSNLQPFLDHPGGSTLLYLMMGITTPQLEEWAGIPDALSVRTRHLESR